ncbi:hypothetical protein FGO68_gene16315 [Halteria grandinella]|uniref:Cytochrome b5 heme-binding domain-containing protein n=1 Tax=Halteria grandinella TaxID=5974 RepID=A0A8J8T6E7_HALGN|nr:hypothetical protein FGO68_gene16315 [Halteria grandinella]
MNFKCERNEGKLPLKQAPNRSHQEITMHYRQITLSSMTKVLMHLLIALHLIPLFHGQNITNDTTVLFDKQDPPYATRIWGTNSNYRLDIRALLYAKPNPLIEFKACFPNGTWFGLGLGGYMMPDTELVFMMAPQNKTLQRTLSMRVSISDIPKTLPDTSPLYNTTISSCGANMVQFLVNRPLNASKSKLSDGTEYTIRVGNLTRMSYAGSYLSFSLLRAKYLPYHIKGMGFYGNFDLTINQDGTISITEESDFYIFHGFLLWFAWGVLGLLQIISGRHIRQFWKTSMWLHRISGILNLAITMTMVLLAFKKVNWKLQNNLHALLGLGVLCVNGLIVLGGFLTRWLIQHFRWGNRRIMWMKFIHSSMGYMTILIAQVAIVTGSLQYAELHDMAALPALLGFIHAIVFGGLIFILEIYIRIYRTREQRFIKPGNVVTRVEFDQRIGQGETLVILDDLVLDVTDFIYEHPGGSFVLNHLVGQDVSKYFYGGYAMSHSTNDRPYYHTNIARAIVNQLAVARIFEKAPIVFATVSRATTINRTTSCFTFVPLAGQMQQRQGGTIQLDRSI